MTNLCHIKSLQVVFIFFLCLVKTKGLEGRRTVIASRFHKISGRVGEKKGKLFYLFSLLSSVFAFFFFFPKRGSSLCLSSHSYIVRKHFGPFFSFLQYSNKTQNDTLGQVVLTAMKTNTL